MHGNEKFWWEGHKEGGDKEDQDIGGRINKLNLI
jgi:hypothetical protein